MIALKNLSTHIPLSTTTRWIIFGTLAVLLQVLIISGLMLENIPSATHAATGHDQYASLKAYSLAGISSAAIVAVLTRFFFGWPAGKPKFVPACFVVLAALIGSVASLVVKGNAPSVVLSSAYPALSLLLLWFSTEYLKAYNNDH